MKRLLPSAKRFLPGFMLALLLLQGCSTHTALPFFAADSENSMESQALQTTAASADGAVVEVAMALPQDFGACRDTGVDTDRDSVPDSCDVCPNTPLAMGVDQRGCPLPAVNPMIVHFALGSDMPLPEERGKLEAVARLLAANPRLGVLVQGHTDTSGPADLNLALSEERAASVERLLARAYNVDSQRMRSRGMGEASPIADNSTLQGRQENRRVELVVVDLGQAMVLAEQRRTRNQAVAEAATQDATAPAEEAVEAANAPAHEEFHAASPAEAMAEPALEPAQQRTEPETAAAAPQELAPHMTHSLMIRLPEAPQADQAAQAEPREISPHVTHSLMIRLPEAAAEPAQSATVAATEQAVVAAVEPAAVAASVEIAQIEHATAHELVIEVGESGRTARFESADAPADRPPLGSLMLRRVPEISVPDSAL